MKCQWHNECQAEGDAIFRLDSEEAVRYCTPHLLMRLVLFVSLTTERHVVTCITNSGKRLPVTPEGQTALSPRE